MKKILYIFVLLTFAIANNLHAEDALPSWNDGKTKQSIITFVEQVTDPNSKSYVKTEERIAVFDNDGTLWAEKPIYFQLEFVKDRILELAPSHPEWKTQQPFKAVLENDNKALAEIGYDGLLELLMTTHAGMTQAQFQDIVKQWLTTAKHPRFNRPYTEIVYQPMLELLTYLRANGFRTYIVSGGGIEFVREF